MLLLLRFPSSNLACFHYVHTAPKSTTTRYYPRLECCGMSRHWYITHTRNMDGCFHDPWMNLKWTILFNGQKCHPPPPSPPSVIQMVPPLLRRTSHLNAACCWFLLLLSLPLDNIYSIFKHSLDTHDNTSSSSSSSLPGIWPSSVLCCAIELNIRIVLTDSLRSSSRNSVHWDRRIWGKPLPAPHVR
jgi:hypothetical protein